MKLLTITISAKGEHTNVFKIPTNACLYLVDKMADQFKANPKSGREKAVNFETLFSRSPHEAILEAHRNGNGKAKSNGEHSEGNDLVGMLHTLQGREQEGIKSISNTVHPVYSVVVEQQRPIWHAVPSLKTQELMRKYGVPMEELRSMEAIISPIISDVHRIPDGVIKSEEQPLRSGIAMVTARSADTGLAFMEPESGHMDDVRRIILNNLDPKGILARNRTKVIPFDGRIMNVGTWQRLAYLDPYAAYHPEDPMRFDVSVFKSTNHVEIRERIREEDRSPVSAKDITDDVSEAARKLGVQNGIVIVFGMHTTIGAALMKPENVSGMIKLLDEVAPNDLSPDLKVPYQHHLNVKDGNGHSHVQSLLMGSDCIVPIKDGVLDIDGRRIMAFDFDDNQAARERRFTVTMIDTEHYLADIRRE
jgi:thiamine phosphate synthase YjbQ (UPF0047 family)